MEKLDFRTETLFLQNAHFTLTSVIWCDKIIVSMKQKDSHYDKRFDTEGHEKTGME